MNRRGDVAEVFCDEGKLANFFGQLREQLTPGRSSPCAVAGVFGVSGNFVRSNKSDEVIDAYEIEEGDILGDEERTAKPGEPEDGSEPGDRDGEGDSSGKDSDKVPGDVPKKDDDSQVAASATSSARERLAEDLMPRPGKRPKKGRNPNRFEEQFVSMAEVDQTMRHGESDIKRALLDVKGRMRRELLLKVRNGSINESSAVQRRLNFRGRKRAIESLARQLDRVAEAGAGHVADEIERQG